MTILMTNELENPKNCSEIYKNSLPQEKKLGWKVKSPEIPKCFKKYRKEAVCSCISTFVSFIYDIPVV